MPRGQEITGISRFPSPKPLTFERKHGLFGPFSAVFSRLLQDILVFHSFSMTSCDVQAPLNSASHLPRGLWHRPHRRATLGRSESALRRPKIRVKPLGTSPPATFRGVSIEFHRVSWLLELYKAIGLQRPHSIQGQADGGHEQEMRCGRQHLCTLNLKAQRLKNKLKLS